MPQSNGAYKNKANPKWNGIVRDREGKKRKMEGRFWKGGIVWLVLMVIVVKKGEGQLVENFYRSSCPNVEQIVKQAVQNKLSQTIITIPATLRLFFHDCFVEVYIYRHAPSV